MANRSFIHCQRWLQTSYVFKYPIDITCPLFSPLILPQYREGGVRKSHRVHSTKNTGVPVAHMSLLLLLLLSRKECTISPPW